MKRSTNNYLIRPLFLFSISALLGACKITMLASPGGSVYVGAENGVACDPECFIDTALESSNTYYAVADEGYEFSHWSGSEFFCTGDQENACTIENQPDSGIPFFDDFLFEITAEFTAKEQITVVQDDFDDDILDPAWNIEFRNAIGWEYTESDSRLAITDIEPEEVYPNSAGSWSIVNLSQEIQPLTDFTADLNLSWNSDGSVTAMQSLIIYLYNEEGRIIAGSGTNDAWIGSNGRKYAHINTTSYNPGGFNLPLEDSTNISIKRVGDEITVDWNNETLLTGNSSDPVYSFTIRVSFYPYDSGIQQSRIGTYWMDSISIRGTAL